MEKNIYLMISKTPTKFGGVIRKVGGVHYNHSAISLDADFNELYAFARVQHNSLLLAGLVKETVPRYTLKKENVVDVVVFKIPVSEKQYQKAKEVIYEIKGNNEYVYNYFSVLTYPITKGFPTYQAFTCVEFVLYVLKQIGYHFDHPGYYYKPDDLLTLFKDNIIFKGNLLDYCHNKQVDERYFSPLTFDVVKKSAICFGKVIHRSLFQRVDN